MWEFLAQHILVVIASILSLGGIGLIVAMFAFGIPVALLLARAVDLFRALLDFLKTPVGQAVAVILIIVLAFVGGDVHRTRLDAQRWAAKERAAEVARVQREDDLKKRVAQEAAARIAEIQKQAEALQDEVNEYEKTLANRAACVATPDDVRRLRKF